jgi:hypothetical protein
MFMELKTPPLALAMMLIAFCIAELKKSKISRSFKFSYSCWDEIEVADAHPPGARSFGQDDYIRKFRELSGLCADSAEQGPMSRFSWQPMMFLNGRPLAEVDAPVRDVNVSIGTVTTAMSSSRSLSGQLRAYTRAAALLRVLQEPWALHER